MCHRVLCAAPGFKDQARKGNYWYSLLANALTQSQTQRQRGARETERSERYCQSRDITIDTVSRKHERKTNTLRVACLRSGRGRRVSREARVSSRVAVDRPQTREIAWLSSRYSRCVVTCRRYDYVCLKIRSIGAIPSVRTRTGTQTHGAPRPALRRSALGGRRGDSVSISLTCAWGTKV